MRRIESGLLHTGNSRACSFLWAGLHSHALHEGSDDRYRDAAAHTGSSRVSSRSTNSATTCSVVLINSNNAGVAFLIVLTM